MPGFGGMLMKRLVYGATIGLVGVLAVVAVKLPVTQEVSLQGDTCVLHGSPNLIDFQNQFEPLRPLIIDRGAPTLPAQASDDFEANKSASLSLAGVSASFPLVSIDEKVSNEAFFGETDLSGRGPVDSIHVDVGISSDLSPSERESGTLTTDISDNRETGFVLLAQVMKKHPLWMEVIRIEREIETCKSRWRSYVDASGITEEDVLKCLGVTEQVLDEQVSISPYEGSKFPEYAGALESGLALVEVSLKEEADARTEAKRIELQANLEDRLYAEKACLNNEFDEFKDRVVKESYLAVINTQMKLRLLRLSDTEREALEEELRGLNDDIEAKLADKRKTQDDVYALYEAEVTAQAEAKLAQYKEEQADWMSSELEKERERLEKEIAGLFSDTKPLNTGDLKIWQEEVSRRGRIELSARRAEISKEFREREAQFTEELVRLAASREQAEDRIKKDIYDAVSDLRDETGAFIQVVEDNSEHREAESLDIDMTSSVIRIIRNRE